MIAVVGNPIGRRVRAAIVAAGLPVAVARSAVAAGGAAQIIGKVGDGTDGDAILLSLAGHGVGHVALLRDLAPASIEPEATAVDPDLPIDELADLADADADETATAASGLLATGPTLDAADLELALRYLPDYRVIVIAQPLDATALAAAVEAVRWSGAQLIVVAWGDGPPAGPLPDGATILEAPSEDAEGAFATVVGRYAAALDEGMAPAAAFEAASGATGWIAVAE